MYRDLCYIVLSDCICLYLYFFYLHILDKHCCIDACLQVGCYDLLESWQVDGHKLTESWQVDGHKGLGDSEK